MRFSCRGQRHGSVWLSYPSTAVRAGRTIAKKVDGRQCYVSTFGNFVHGEGGEPCITLTIKDRPGI